MWSYVAGLVPIPHPHHRAEHMTWSRQACPPETVIG